MEDVQDDIPLFSAVSSSARQLFLLLRCINFASKAQVQLSAAGIRFTVEESSVMEGMAFLSKDLFTSYTYNAAQTTTSRNSPEEEQPNDTSIASLFSVSLPSLLETLQILGLDLPPTRPWNTMHPTTAFDTRALGVTGLCRLRYDTPGSPLEITLTESNLTTTCALTTYEPHTAEDIPFARQALSLKIITRASLLYDALSELSATSPDILTLSASSHAPYFSLSATGPLGSAVVDFGSKDKELLETFQVAPAEGRSKVIQSYRFALVKAAMRACACAAKVSIRGDEQGVLSLQFMIEVEGEGKVSFVDFRCVPLAEGDDGLDGDENEDENEGGGNEEMEL